MGQGASAGLLNCGKQQQQQQQLQQLQQLQLQQHSTVHQHQDEGHGRRRRWHHWRQEAWNPRTLAAHTAHSPDSTTLCCSGWGSHSDEIKTSQGGVSGDANSGDSAVPGAMPIGGDLTVGGAGAPPQPPLLNYDPECARMEAWLDEHQDFVHDYFIRKASRHMVDMWLVSHAVPQNIGGGGVYSGAAGGGGEAGGGASGQPPGSRTSSGAATPVRKISAHEFEKGGLVKPIVTTIDGTPTFLSPPAASENVAILAKVRRKSRTELKGLDERQLIFELVKDICNDLDVRSLCHKILQNVSILTSADRCSLFLVQGDKESENRCLVSTLFDVNPDSTVEEMQEKEEIRIPWGSGVVGYTAQSGAMVNIPDAYEDPRFNPNIDGKTGYKTRSMLCMPIKDSAGEVIGVAQVINKHQGQIFTTADEKVFESYLQFCGIGLRNAQLYERSQLEVKRNQVLLDLARIIFEEQSTIEQMVYRIMTHTQSLLQCERVQILLVHEASRGAFSRVFDLEVKDLQGDDAESRTSPFESRFPINIGITGHVATTGETVCIADAYEDSKFDESVDENTGFRHRSVLCMPIKNTAGKTVGVVQLINKFDNLPFTKNDENFLEAFAIFCGMGIHNTHMYEKAITAMAKQKVTLEVLSYHATAPREDALRLMKLKIPSAQAFKLYDFKFDDFSLDDDGSLKACLRMFLDLDLIGRFHIEYEVLCRWLLSVKKNYRNVTYHNWRHAFNVAQMMFAIITTTQWWKVLGELECLALLVACLCHDLDHRGTNNSFQIKASSPLAQLYTTSTMEHHHFDQSVMILNSAGNQILSNCTPDEYSRVISVMEDAILATDLAVYFRKRGGFFSMVKGKQYDFKKEECRVQLRGMMMTICDIAAITKPWAIQKQVAELVAGEFFEQGDIEKEELKITPIDMMNREKKDKLPQMQVLFIDSICLPVYEVFADLTSELKPLLEGVVDNRKNWQMLADEALNKDRPNNNNNNNTNNNNNSDDAGMGVETAPSSD
ncbi:dual 3',5'-cyclic-AMP and -GMP phosphodiesterase 11 isoform X1 [Procambarus clarkii]|uniref:dual 3',5'-cyclic-AMP and -GMP phosphodiesterase 11 isoform X1 n=1 Tax=Procambarus clarkii TaxID=6728 RepID=UPI001E67064B|nr:dual 3',5'-cyclic-AMP and -GMP phosphodiesterase 11-like isoform X2 [Procambarus clarkii]